MLLARKGHRVLLVDRATFPSDIPHGHLIHRGGPRLLHDWGLLDGVIATGCPPIDSVTLDFGDFPLTGAGLAADGVAVAYGPRRSALDKVLVDAAVEAGAELREGFVVEGFAGDGDRIAGIRGRHAGGRAAVTERATVTVGADGRNSRLARTVEAAASYAGPRSPAGTSPTGATSPARRSSFTCGSAGSSSRSRPMMDCSSCSLPGRRRSWTRCAPASRSTSWPRGAGAVAGPARPERPPRGAVCRRHRPAQLSPEAVRCRLGACRRRWGAQESPVCVRHMRRLSRRGAAGRRAR